MWTDCLPAANQPGGLTFPLFLRNSHLMKLLWRNFSTVSHVVMFSAQCNQPFIVQTPFQCFTQLHNVMHFRVLIGNPLLCAVQSPQTNLTEISVSLFDFLSLLLPCTCRSKEIRLVPFVRIISPHTPRFFRTHFPLPVDFPTVCTALSHCQSPPSPLAV